MSLGLKHYRLEKQITLWPRRWERGAPMSLGVKQYKTQNHDASEKKGERVPRYICADDICESQFPPPLYAEVCIYHYYCDSFVHQHNNIGS
jgi:hypothetical protein